MKKCDSGWRYVVDSAGNSSIVLVILKLISPNVLKDQKVLLIHFVERSLLIISHQAKNHICIIQQSNFFNPDITQGLLLTW